MRWHGRERSTGVHAASGRAWLMLLLASLTTLLVVASAHSAKAEPGTSGETGSAAITGSILRTDAGAAVASWERDDFLTALPAEPPGAPENAQHAFDVPDLSAASASAADGDFLPADINRFPLRTSGKVFFRLGGEEFLCSGTVVSSRGRNVLLTAGHCVYDTESAQYVDELVFVPAYAGDQPDVSPFGVWGAAAVFTSSRFVETGSLSHDIGAVVLANRIQDTLGSRRIAFNLDPTDRLYTIYGYPLKPSPPYDGEAMVGCRSVVKFRDSTAGSPFPLAAGPCVMRGGSSGGGWITESGYLNSVVSYGYCESVPSLCGTTFGPYFGDQAKSLYTFPAVGGSVDPTVKIQSGPRGNLRRSTASFRFQANGSTPLVFRCRLDRKPFSDCGSRATFRGLRRGIHIVRVRVIDQTGRASEQTAIRRFRVVRPGR